MTQQIKSGKKVLQDLYKTGAVLPKFSTQDLLTVSDWDWVINAVADPTYKDNAVKLIKLRFFNDLDDNIGTILATLLNRVHGVNSPDDLRSIFTDTNVTTLQET